MCKLGERIRIQRVCLVTVSWTVYYGFHVMCKLGGENPYTASVTGTPISFPRLIGILVGPDRLAQGAWQCCRSLGYQLRSVFASSVLGLFGLGQWGRLN
jgi:hypothetical protein